MDLAKGKACILLTLRSPESNTGPGAPQSPVKILNHLFIDKITNNYWFKIKSSLKRSQVRHTHSDVEHRLCKPTRNGKLHPEILTFHPISTQWADGKFKYSTELHFHTLKWIKTAPHDPPQHCTYLL